MFKYPKGQIVYLKPGKTIYKAKIITRHREGTYTIEITHEVFNRLPIDTVYAGYTYDHVDEFWFVTNLEEGLKKWKD